MSWGQSLGLGRKRQVGEVFHNLLAARRGARARRLAKRSRVIRLALLPEPRPKARKRPTRPSAREARSQGEQSSDLQGQHPCGSRLTVCALLARSVAQEGFRGVA